MSGSSCELSALERNSSTNCFFLSCSSSRLFVSRPFLVPPYIFSAVSDTTLAVATFSPGLFSPSNSVRLTFVGALATAPTAAMMGATALTWLSVGSGMCTWANTLRASRWGVDSL